MLLLPLMQLLLLTETESGLHQLLSQRKQLSQLMAVWFIKAMLQLMVWQLLYVLAG
jgi:hypothetical protein